MVEFSYWLYSKIFNMEVKFLTKKLSQTEGKNKKQNENKSSSIQIPHHAI